MRKNPILSLLCAVSYVHSHSYIGKQCSADWTDGYKAKRMSSFFQYEIDDITLKRLQLSFSQCHPRRKNLTLIICCWNSKCYILDVTLSSSVSEFWLCAPFYFSYNCFVRHTAPAVEQWDRSTDTFQWKWSYAGHQYFYARYFYALKCWESVRERKVIDTFTAGCTFQKHK
jgi:hypothetical protein